VNLSGVFPPVTTPFDDRGRVDPGALAENLARYERHGTAGYLILGSTGEAAYLEENEKLELVRAARRALPSGRILIAGVGLESTAATIRLTAAAADCGADLALVITPFYFRSRMTGEALRRHFETVAGASPIPILLYNVPKFTGLELPAAVAVALSNHPNVAGLKDSSGDLAKLREVLGRVPTGFRVLCGSVSIFEPALAAGAVGGVLAAADVVPEPLVALHRAHVAGDRDRARALQAAVTEAGRLIVDASGVPGIKAGMDVRGLRGGAPRPPLPAASSDERESIRREVARLVEAGILPTVSC
jgi:dihydrodipicolinate synthase/N-acetylneuraminate lyase